MSQQELKQWIVDRKQQCESNGEERIQEYDDREGALEYWGMAAAFEEVLEKLRNEEIE